jgi:MEMO1 family protein
MQRPPAVTGQFYPDQPEQLRQLVERLLVSSEPARPALGVVSPHAGYLYSGAIAGATFAGVKAPSTAVILGPNHHGLGHPAAVFASGSWLTPLGETPVDRHLADRILRECPGVGSDALAHRYEHSLEVQLPFLQVLSPELSIVPICLSHAPLPELLALGESLGALLADSGDDVLVVASSDMTHYEPGETARGKDLKAIENILALDPEGVYRTVRDERISMCGVVPVVVMLAAARRRGAVRAQLVRYGNSGEVTGDQSEVVGYAGVIVS